MRRNASYLVGILLASMVFTGGCGKGGFDGYCQGWLYPENVSTVYVEMFDSKSFRRDYEYELTSAICKQLEVQTPYKIIADRNAADTILSGQITSIGSATLTTDRESGLAIEKETRVNVVYSWKDLRSGDLLIDNEKVTGVSSYSEDQLQNFDYAMAVAVNDAANRLVESMQSEW